MMNIIFHLLCKISYEKQINSNWVRMHFSQPTNKPLSICHVRWHLTEIVDDQQRRPSWQLLLIDSYTPLYIISSSFLYIISSSSCSLLSIPTAKLHRLVYLSTIIMYSLSAVSFRLLYFPFSAVLN